MTEEIKRLQMAALICEMTGYASLARCYRMILDRLVREELAKAERETT